MILDEIVAHKKSEVAARMRHRSPRDVALTAERAPAPPDFRRALVGPGLAVIAEIKGASPSEGPIRNDFDPVSVARAYERGGAAALSVLTDSRYFHGSWEALAAVCRAARLPVLCKEFIIDPYQIDEARAAGAAAVLLIVAILEESRLREYLGHSRQRGLAALVEVHTPGEVTAALESGAGVIGINNRDLRTLVIDLETTTRLRPMIPREIVVVSESGFERREQVARLEQLGIDAVLIGTSLMASSDPAAKLRELRGA